MVKTFVFVMDPLEKVNIRTDTSFAFMHTAFNRGHHVYHVSPHHISLHNDTVLLLASRLELFDRLGDHFRVTEKKVLQADQADAIFIRTDPPFDLNYLHVTWVLSFAEDQGVRFINSPRGIRSANEKLYALFFAKFCPETIVTPNKEDITAFVHNHHDQAIAKPTDGHGGFGVVKLNASDSNMAALIDLLTLEGKRPIVVQEYLSNAAHSDKRLLVMDGELKGAVQRIPASGDHRGNVHVGGHTIACNISERDREIVAAMRDRLRNDGLYFVGLDVIDGKLIEVNVTSPTLLRDLHHLGGPDLALQLIESLEAN